MLRISAKDNVKKIPKDNEKRRYLIIKSFNPNKVLNVVPAC